MGKYRDSIVKKYIFLYSWVKMEFSDCDIRCDLSGFMLHYIQSIK